MTQPIAPAPKGSPLPMTIESGAPMTVHVKYQGKAYALRVTTTVLAVFGTGVTGPDGMPVFHVQGAPVMIVSEDVAS
jgi:hypothetical protein